VPLVSAYRYDGPEVNTSLAHSEAKILQDKIHDKAYADEEVIRILTTRSKAQLLATFNSYNDQFSHPINKVSKNYPLPCSNSSLFRQTLKVLPFELNYLNDEFREAAITLNDNNKNFCKMCIFMNIISVKHLPCTISWNSRKQLNIFVSK
jgi:hypothetical protein